LKDEKLKLLKNEGRRKKEEGRRKKEEVRKKKEEYFDITFFFLMTSLNL
jgi:hypothetical protein